MPCKWTFQIEGVQKLLAKYLTTGTGWIDPFAGMHSPAEFTNDLNPESPAKCHLDAFDFVNQLDDQVQYQGCIFDPPYSLTQVSRAYRGFGLKFKGKENPTGGYPKVKDRIALLLPQGSVVISFGWNTVGFGKDRGFKKEEILILEHGGNRNNTLVTVERKILPWFMPLFPQA